MPMMQESDYLKQRLEDQLNWLEARGTSNQSTYKRLRLIEITAAALIPFLAGMEGIPHGTVIVGALGVVVTLCTGMMSLGKYHENWIQYRTTAEQLKQERYFFLTGSGPYADNPNLNLLVERVEALLAKENATWAQVAASKAAPAKPASDAGDEPKP